MARVRKRMPGVFGFTSQVEVQDILLAGPARALCFSGLFAMEHHGGMEYQLLCYLLQYQGRVLSRQQILSEV